MNDFVVVLQPLMTEQVRLAAEAKYGSMQVAQPFPQSSPANTPPVNTYPNPSYASTYGIGNMMGGIPQAMRSLSQQHTAPPKTAAEMQALIPTILQLTEDMMQAPESANQIPADVISSANLPRNLKVIKNISKKKGRNPITNAPVVEENPKRLTTQGVLPHSQIAINNVAYMTTPAAQNIQQLPVANMDKPTHAKGPVLKASRASDDGETLKQILPDDNKQLEQLPQGIEQITPNINQLNALQSKIGRVSNVSAGSAKSFGGYTPYNSSYDYNEGLKLPNLTDLSEFHISALPTSPPPNILSGSDGSIFPSLASNIPPNLAEPSVVQQNVLTPNSQPAAYQNLPQNVITIPLQQNIQQPSKTPTQPQPQLQPAAQQGKANTQQFLIPNQKQPGPAFNSNWGGYGSITSNLPPYLNDPNGIQKPKYMVPPGPQNINNFAYINNLKNPFQPQYK